jgi:protein-S-isoprenylcysteine O-methyltransferase Ste14
MELKIPPPVIALITGFFMWGISSLNLVMPILFEYSTVLVLVLIACGVGIGTIASTTFNKAKTTIDCFNPRGASSLVCHGVFGYTRNPMYLGLLIVLISVVIWFGSVLNLALLVLFFWYVTKFQIKPEERMLKEKFPREVADYYAKVRRWI